MTPTNRKSSEEEFVPVIFTEDYTEAEYYKALLEDHGLDARIGDDVEPPEPAEGEEQEEAPAQGIPVMVPNDSLSEAEDILDRHHEAEDDFDEDEDDDDYEDDEFEEFEEFDPDEEEE